MSIWEDVGSSYVDAAASALPLHRLVIFLAGFSASVILPSQEYLSVVESLARLPLAEFYSSTSGLLGRAVIMDAAVGLLLVFSGALISGALVRLIFYFAGRATDLDRRMGVIGVLPTERAGYLDLKEELAFIDRLLEEPKSRLRQLSTTYETLISLGVGAVVAFFAGGILDVIVGVAFCLVGFLVQVFAVRYFLGNYYGMALVKSRILRQDAPTLG